MKQVDNIPTAAFTLREATVEDVAELRQFLQHIVTAERPMDDTLQSGFIEYYNPEDFITDENAIAIVAEHQGRLVGCGAAQIRDSKHYYTHNKHTHLSMMYVSPECRGMGVNQLVIEKLKNWSHHHNVYQMQLTVYPDNPAAIRAYEKAGFSAGLIEMRIDTKKSV